MEQERPWLKSQPERYNLGPPPEKKAVYSVLTDSARKSPSKTCLHYNGRDFSYAKVDELSSRFAAALSTLGVRKGDRVAIFTPNIPQFVIAYFGILKSGATVVTNNPLYKARELEFQLRDSGAQVIVATQDVVKGVDLFKSLEDCRGSLGLRHVIATSVTDFLPGVKRRLAGLAGVKKVSREGTADFAGLIDSSGPLIDPAAVNPEQDVAQLQYTGGTTGVPKGAMLTHYNLYSNAIYLSRLAKETEEDVSLCVLPLFHIYGLTVTMNAPLSVGAELVLLPSFHTEEVMRTIQNRKVTVFCGAPAMYIAVNNSPKAKRFDLRSVRVCASGGSALPVEVRRKFIELTHGNLVEGYGLSETGPVTHMNPVTGGVVKDGSIGPPFPETDAQIVDLDDWRKVLPLGATGELAVKGPQVMKGYWNMGEETRLVLHDGWLLTGDVAKMDEDGYFYIVDRKKDMLNVAGYKVYPREVEEVLFESPAVKDAGVVGIPDAFSGEAVKAFVVLKDPQGAATEKEIIDFCAERLAKYKVPRQVEFVPELPKTLIGKVLRRKLREATSRQS